MNIAQLTELIQKFRNDRNWNQSNAKDYCVALSAEAGELLHEFMWVSDEDVKTVTHEKKEAIADEMADVLFCLLCSAKLSDINIEEALINKLKKLEQKYPKP